MAILIRTSDVPPEELRDAWRAVVCDTLGPLYFRSDPGIPLRGEIAAGQLGPVNVGRVETSTPHSVYRTPGLIRRDSPAIAAAAAIAVTRSPTLSSGRPRTWPRSSRRPAARPRYSAGRPAPGSCYGRRRRTRPSLG